VQNIPTNPDMVSAEDNLYQFLRISAEDGRIGPAHISLYVALMQSWRDNNFKSPFPIVRNQVMQRAKINGRSTYLRYIRDLNQFGYIWYKPTYNHSAGSMIAINTL
jgi:hypothetical protein